MNTIRDMKKTGFTLVEVMVVVAVIGLLAAMAVPAVMKSIRNSRIKQARTELAMISSAVDQLAWDTGKWPNQSPRTSAGSTEIWEISPDVCGLLGNDGSYEGWKGPYYDGAINDPWGNPYFFDPDYNANGGVHIVVGSFGPNGVGRNLYDSDDIYILLDE